MVTALGLALLVAAQPASADDNFEEGKKLYFDLEYELAVFRFRDAARNEGWEVGRRAQAYAWLGLAYAQIAELSSAKEAFVEAARLDANVTLPDNASPPPKAQQLLDEAKSEVANLPAAPPPDTSGGTTTDPPPTDPAATTSDGDTGGAASGPSAANLALFYGGIGTAGASLIAFGIGGTFGVLAQLSQQEGIDAEYQDEAAAALERGQGQALVANIVFVVGGVMAVAGLGALGASFLVE
jgi:tetratricopeptide (TPR) repeat protein